MSCGAEVTAKRLYDALKADASFDFPELDWDDPDLQFPPTTGELYEPIEKLKDEDLTTGLINGDGTFDKLMASIKHHLRGEFEDGRITGREFSEAYTQSTVAALGTAVQYLLGKDQANWQAILLQLQAREAAIAAINAKVTLRTSMLQYEVVRMQAEMSVIDYANKKIQLAIADEDYCLKIQQGELNEIEKSTRQYNLDTILPLQSQMLTEQIAGQVLDNTGQGIQNDTATYNLDEILPKQAAQLTVQTDNLTKQGLGIVAQTANVESDTAIKGYQLSDMLPAELAQTEAQTTNLGKQGIILDDEHDLNLLRATGLGIDNNTKTYNLNTMLPAQMAGVVAQTDMVTAQIVNESKRGLVLDQNVLQLQAEILGIGLDNDTKTYNLANILPKNLELLTAQVAGVEADTDGKIYNVTYVLPKQLELVSEQVESTRAQTMDTRTDGTTVITGLLGKQKALYEQQITSYQRDSEVKAAKMFIDAWITQKTIDEGLLPPEGFENDNLDLILAKLISNNGFGTMIAD
jgi:hypothetical protein